MKLIMRTFVAIEINDSTVIQQISNVQSEIKITGKAVDVKKIHFTLFFLGEIKKEMVSKILDALGSIRFESFSVNFIGLETFPKIPKIVSVKVDEKSGQDLINLADKVKDALEPLGFTRDKPFRPHVTIFRIKSKFKDLKNDLEKYKNMKFGTQSIEKIILEKSELFPDGPVYYNLGEVASL